jgi:hypothetical protein
MTECDNFKSDAGGGELGAEKLLRGDFFEEFGLDTKILRVYLCNNDGSPLKVERHIFFETM